MPTDVNVPRWRCDLCATVYEGPDAKPAAHACETAPTPAPLPAGTWLMSRFSDLLDPTRWRQVTAHRAAPAWRWTPRPVDESDAADELELTAIVPAHVRASAQRPADEHVHHYDETFAPRTVAGRTITESRAASRSDYLWPHQPGVLNLGINVERPSVAPSIGDKTALGHGRRDKTLSDLEDAACAAALRAQLAAGPDTAAHTRYQVGPHRFTWDVLRPDSSTTTFLRPGLDAATRDALFALCTDTLTSRGGYTPLRDVLHRDAPTTVSPRRSPWSPTDDHPHWGVSQTLRRDGQFWSWVEVLALRDHDGDAAAAMRWLLTSTLEAKFDRLEAEVQAFLDGDPDRLIHAGLLVASHGMTRGTRYGRLRPEHKDAAVALGVDWATARPADALAPYLHNATTALTYLGVTLMNHDTTPLGGAPVITVGSGKGGVGKTTTAAALAEAHVRAGHRVLLIDADVTGPSLGALYDLPAGIPIDADGALTPTEPRPGLMVMSASQVTDPDVAIKWGEDTTRMWLRFIATATRLADDLAPDLVIVDLPPGYTEQHRAVRAELSPTGCVLVTTGSRLAHADLARFAAITDHPRTALLETLSVTPSGERLYPPQATIDVAAALDIPYAGSLPWNDDPSALADLDPIRTALDLVAPATATSTA